jgi:hypothetical protein
MAYALPVLVIKAELKDELRRELVTKEEFFGEIGKLEQKIETVRQELKGEIRELRAYLKIMLIVLALGFTLFNPQFLELIKSLFSLLK